MGAQPLQPHKERRNRGDGPRRLFAPKSQGVSPQRLPVRGLLGASPEVPGLALLARNWHRERPLSNQIGDPQGHSDRTIRLSSSPHCNPAHNASGLVRSRSSKDLGRSKNATVDLQQSLLYKSKVFARCPSLHTLNPSLSCWNLQI